MDPDAGIIIQRDSHKYTCTLMLSHALLRWYESVWEDLPGPRLIRRRLYYVSQVTAWTPVVYVHAHSHMCAYNCTSAHKGLQEGSEN